MVDEDKRVHRIVVFLVMGGITTLLSVFIHRPSAIVLAWVGGFLVGLVVEFRDRAATTQLEREGWIDG